LTYTLRNGDLADSFCERLTGALPANTLTARQSPCKGSNIWKLYIERPQEPDLYTTVTDTLRAKVPWDLGRLGDAACFLQCPVRGVKRFCRSVP
jgi:hypothetical protein